MTPQHFQQQALWEQHTNEHTARIASPEPWGTVRVGIDSQALSIHRLMVNALAIRLPDGTVIDTDTADHTPPARDLADVPSNVDSVVVLIGLPLIDTQGGNCAWGRQGRDKCRTARTGPALRIRDTRRLRDLPDRPADAHAARAIRTRSGVRATVPLPVSERPAHRAHAPTLGNPGCQEREPCCAQA
ncbi:hypothetical protein Rmet_0623 [Cupriavidus metallidurans CH34]|uniref:Uncharacterized protein n=1 Tax=Cupriavidus metallidurans (strain ATCC 43123 / DSM 2839 / NBRC 102507 / CH34) TaxID=266264 RepID=Q1LQR7_CUPMC|nr:hypothetical protein Rmet_0623 [Cupriavidus metallidurans CH34]